MKRIALYLLATLILNPAFLTSGQAQSTKLTIGRSVGNDALPLIIAKEKDIFARHGLDVTLLSIPVPSNIGPSLISGSLQIGGGTPISMLQAAEAGLRFKVVTGGTRYRADNPSTGLLSRSGISVTKPADLVGKKVAVPGLNSGNYMLLLKWLKDAGVPAERVTFVEAPVPSMGDMLKGGTIDVAVINDPNRSRIVAAGNAVMSVPFVAEINPDIVNIFWIANEKWANTNKEAVQRFRAAVAEALTWMAQNPAEAEDIEKRTLGSSSPRLPPYSQNVSVGDLRFYENLGRELGFLQNAQNLDQMVPD